MRALAIALFSILTVFANTASILAQSNIAIQVNGCPLKVLTREICALKAIRAMEKEKFLYAVVESDGTAWGYGEKASLVVLSFASVDGTSCLLIASSSDNAEAVRLSGAVRSALCDAPHDPKTPKKIGTLDLKQKAKVPQLGWQVESRSMVSTLRFFEAGASIALEKQGMLIQHSEKTLILSGGQGGATTSFAAPGANALTANIGVVVASWDDETARHLAKLLERAIVHVLYE
jgi:hypothetical protein